MFDINSYNDNKTNSRITAVDINLTDNNSPPNDRQELERNRSEVMRLLVDRCRRSTETTAMYNAKQNGRAAWLYKEGEQLTDDSYCCNEQDKVKQYRIDLLNRIDRGFVVGMFRPPFRSIQEGMGVGNGESEVIVRVHKGSIPYIKPYVEQNKEYLQEAIFP